MSIGELRCPAIRSLVTGNQLQHVEFLAQVHDVVRVLSGGQGRELASDEPGSIANVAGFFAVHNHSVTGNEGGGSLRRRLGLLREKIGKLVDAGSVLAGKETEHMFNLRFFKSAGDHPGTVDFFTNDTSGVFDPTRFENTMKRFAVEERLTIDGIAQMIIQANGADPNATALDLGKSAGEWALMVCALGDPISVNELRTMYRDGNFERLLQGTRLATARQWVAMTIRISKAIAGESLKRKLHFAFGDDFNDDDDNLCPCVGCNPEAWI